jgi:hypothetical protein
MVTKLPVVYKKCGDAERFNENPAVELLKRDDTEDIYFIDWGFHAYCTRCNSRISDFNLPSFVVSTRLDEHLTIKMI